MLVVEELLQKNGLSFVNMVASTITDTTDSDNDTITDDSDNDSEKLWNRMNSSEELSFKSDTNVIYSLRNRENYGRITKHSKSRTEQIYNNIPRKCSTYLQAILPTYEVDIRQHIFMGFTLCSRYLLSYTANLDLGNLGPFNIFGTVEYTLYIWQFVPYGRLTLVSKHQIFRHAKSADYMYYVSFSQWPGDCFKLICYGILGDVQCSSYVTLLTIPTPKNCLSCIGDKNLNIENNSQGWCLSHGFTVDFMYNLQHSNPGYVPEVSLTYPDHMVINTGHHIHILNISPAEETQPVQPLTFADLFATKEPTDGLSLGAIFNDAFSERSETPFSEHFENNSVVEAIIQDFNEYDCEGIECSKPFHELNISCEPLNVTGKSYHSGVLESRLKRSGHAASAGAAVEQTKIDKRIADKAYEFTEENEKFEKFSSFRKKRFADKKYEFSEDNSENIVPFNSLRHQRRYLYRSQNTRMRVPDVHNIYFLSPHSPAAGLRSPILSPNSRNVYYPAASLRSPHYSRSPLSPRDSARKFNVYSPSLDSDYSDADSKLILRAANANSLTSARDSISDFAAQRSTRDQIIDRLAVDTVEDSPGWIKKVVRRYSSLDFDTSSLVSGQSRDDFNTPIELPLLVNPLVEHDTMDVPVSKFNPYSENETQLIISQRTFDCEQFIQRRAEQLCDEAKMHFTHCEDYDVSLLQICPLTGDIVCGVTFKIGAVKNLESPISQTYLTRCMFIWNIETDSFKVIESNGDNKLTLCCEYDTLTSNGNFNQFKLPKLNCRKPTTMRHNDADGPVKRLRDTYNYIEICLDPPLLPNRFTDGSDLFYVFYTSDNSNQ